jgi:hypothetical protein
MLAQSMHAWLLTKDTRSRDGDVLTSNRGIRGDGHSGDLEVVAGCTCTIINHKSIQQSKTITIIFFVVMFLLTTVSPDISRNKGGEDDKEKDGSSHDGVS